MNFTDLNKSTNHDQVEPSAPPIVVQGYIVNSVDDYYKNATNNENLFNVEKFRDFIEEYEISEKYAKKLRQLEAYDIVFVCDDSGSMKSTVTTPNTKSTDVLQTRWKEMKNIVEIVVKLASILDDDGIDVYMLNRTPLLNVTSVEELQQIFKNDPRGSTPILRTLKQVIRDKSQALSEKKLLMILCTDGEPTSESGEVVDSGGVSEITKLFNFLKYERIPQHKIHVAIVACTDDDKTMEYLENWDSKLENFDVIDDFYSERERIQKANGAYYRFSFGDYIVKILLGSIDKDIGSLDGSCQIKKANQNFNSIQNKKNTNQNFNINSNRNKGNECIIL